MRALYHRKWTFDLVVNSIQYKLLRRCVVDLQFHSISGVGLVD